MNSSPTPRSGIFISYRRSEASGFAGRLYAQLTRAFGDDHVFMDVTSIQPGQDFREVMLAAAGQSTVLLVIIGSDWLDITDKNHRRRLENPGDPVRVEIQTALDRKITIVPVLIDSAPMPARHRLPRKLQPLAQCHAIRVRHESFRSDTQRLIKSLRHHLSDIPRDQLGDPRAEGAAGTITRVTVAPDPSLPHLTGHEGGSSKTRPPKRPLRHARKLTPSRRRMGIIFVSYRHEDARATAGRLYDRLVLHYGQRQVFMDVDAISLGAKSGAIRMQALQNSSVLIVVIGPHWLGESKGHRLVDRPYDPIRVELETSLELNKRVIPVLVDGATMPTSGDLPPTLSRLVRRHRFTLRHDAFDEDLSQLVNQLRRLPTTPRTFRSSYVALCAAAFTVAASLILWHLLINR